MYEWNRTQEAEYHIQRTIESKDREISILRFLSGPLTKREIADELYISENTIRWYVKNIYIKLGVNGRRRAVERADELGIF